MPQTSADDNFRSQKEFDESPPLMFHNVNRNEKNKVIFCE